MPTVGVGISREQSASVSLGENTGELTPEERQRVNKKLGASIDSKLGGSVKAAFGLNLDLAKVVALTGALKAGIRSKLNVSLGVTKSTGAGAQAGGGASAGASVGASASGGAGVSLGGSGGVQGRVSLGASLGLNGGTTAGGEGTPLAGVKIQAGIDPNGIPGLTAGITVLDPEAVKVRVSASRDVKVTLDGMLSDALAGSGLSKQKQELVKSELKPKLDQALDDSFRSSFGPNPEFPHAMGNRVLDANIRMPRTREWTGNVTIDQLEQEAEPPTGPFWLEIEGLEFRCSVIPGRSGRSQGGRTSLRVVGGAGGLAHKLDVRNYSGGLTTGKLVVDDILRDAGETLSAESDSTILAKKLEGWQRVEGHGRFALDLITAKLGVSWRILRDGTVWIGVDEWPEVEPDGTVLDDDWGDGSIELAPDTPTMVPGIVVRGQRVEEVVHRLERSGLRTTLRSVGVRQLFDDALEPVRHQGEYAKRYRCKVVSQGSDGRVDVLVDDERMKGRGVAKCAVRAGLPGTEIKVPSGSRCLVGWDDADPALPYVSDWESSALMTSITIGRDARPVARIGDTVTCFLSPGTPIAGSISGNPLVGGLLTVLTPVIGIIDGGSNAMNVGSA